MPDPAQTTARLQCEIAELLQREVVLAGVAPQAAAGFVTLGGQPRLVVGFAGRATERSVFDLASITKTCVALTTSLLIERGRLAWTTQVQEVLPWLAGTPGGEASVEAHLSHRAGLAAHREFFRPAQAGLPVHRRALLLAAAGAKKRGSALEPLYSDLGYLLVGELLCELQGEPLDRIVQEELTKGRGWAIASARQWRAGRDAAFSDAVPSEIVPSRGGLVRGLVHDDNAWALGGSGMCGHAGLFGTASGVLGLARSLLEAAVGRGELVAPARMLLKRRPGGTLRLGLDGVARQADTGAPLSAAGSLVGPNTFGHLGFTGTSFWCDPDAEIALCLLTNRVCPSRQNLAIRAARPRVHDALLRLARLTQAP